MIATLVMMVVLDEAKFWSDREVELANVALAGSDRQVLLHDYHRFDSAMPVALENWKLADRHYNDQGIRGMVVGWHGHDILTMWESDVEHRRQLWFELHLLNYYVRDRGVSYMWLHDDGRVADNNACPDDYWCGGWTMIVRPRTAAESATLILTTLNNIRSIMGEDNWDSGIIPGPLPVYKTRP